MKKRIILSAFLVVLMLLCTPVASAASMSESINLDSWVVRTRIDGGIYLENLQTGEHMIKAYGYDQFGNLHEIDLVEHAAELNQAKSIQRQDSAITQSESVSGFIGEQAQPRTSLPVVIHTYTETRKYKGIGSPRKCTPDHKGPNTLRYGVSVSVTDSFGGSISLGSGEKSAIKAGANFSWQHSVSSGASFGAGYPVPAGRIGYVQFRPYYNVSRGTLRTRAYLNNRLISDESHDAWGQCPIKLGDGFADGLYELVTRPA